MHFQKEEEKIYKSKYKNIKASLDIFFILEYNIKEIMANELYKRKGLYIWIKIIMN